MLAFKSPESYKRQYIFVNLGNSKWRDAEGAWRLTD